MPSSIIVVTTPVTLTAPRDTCSPGFLTCQLLFGSLWSVVTATAIAPRAISSDQHIVASRHTSYPGGGIYVDLATTFGSGASEILIRRKAYLLLFSVFSFIVLSMVTHMRHTRAHTANRRSHHALKAPSMILCKETGLYRGKHVMCAITGKYKGRVVVDMQKKIDKKKAKRDARAGR